MKQADRGTTPTARVLDTPIPVAADLAALEPIERIRKRWPTVLGAVLSAAMIVGLGFELFGEGLDGLRASVPESALFYVAILLLYLSPPTFDYVIFRHLWGIPLAGMAALHKKRIANEVVLGYSGEAFFYAWARARMKMVAAPFGAVKDVSILSAMAGNIVTLAMVAIALPFGASLLEPDDFEKLAYSVGILVAITVPFLIFSRRVFSLERPVLWWVFGVHSVRLIVGSTLIALAWHFAMPDTGIGTWLLLAAGRLLVSRLPFVPSKDLLFANFAIILIGQGEALSELMAFTAALALVMHAVLIAAFSLHALLRSKP